MTAASLHLGEVEKDASNFKEGKTACSIKNMDKMKFVADLLLVDCDELCTEILNKEASPGIAARTPWKPDDVDTAI